MKIEKSDAPYYIIAGTFRDRNISRGLFLVYGTPL